MALPPAERPDRPLAAFAPANAPAGMEPHFPVLRPVATIGQGPQNDIILDDDTVSTRHARLEYADGGWRLTDLQSKNGTYVNGVRLAPGTPTPLLDDAVVAFGAMKLGFTAIGETDPAESLASYEVPAAGDGKARPTGFRLPVWLLALILFFVALLVFLYLWFGGDPQAIEPATTPAVFLPLFELPPVPV
jgi:hypothetical protein